MRFLKRLIWTTIFLFVTVLVVGLFLPARAHVERSTIVEASADTVYPLVSNFRQFNRWSPWLERDPDTTLNYHGPESGKGARMTWTSEHPEVGSGSQEIVAAQPPKMVKTHLDFGAQGSAYATFRIEDQGERRCRVTWAFDSEFGYDILGRYFGLMFERWIGPDYENGLARLKQIAERG